MTSDFLQKNFNNIDNVNQFLIDEEISSKLSKDQNDRFEKGVQLIDSATEQIKAYNPLAVVSIVRALMYSPYIFLKIYKIYRIHTIL